MNMVISSDHGGFALKQHVAAWLAARGLPFEDLGPHTGEPVDYQIGRAHV